MAPRRPPNKVAPSPTGGMITRGRPRKATGHKGPAARPAKRRKTSVVRQNIPNLESINAPLGHPMHPSGNTDRPDTPTNNLTLSPAGGTVFIFDTPMESRVSSASQIIPTTYPTVSSFVPTDFPSASHPQTHPLASSCPATIPLYITGMMVGGNMTPLFASTGNTL